MSEKPDISDDLSSGLRVTWIGLVVNVLLVVFKLWAGTISRSQALVADAVHSLSDIFSDVVVLLGLKWARKDEDDTHPYGHARIETISSMVVGLLLVLVGVGIAYKATMSIYNHDVSRPGPIAIFAAATSILLKEAMFWYTRLVGMRLKSPLLIANAWHHRSDALSSVAVLLGVTAVYVNPNWHLADAYAALVVTFFIVKVGLNLTWLAFKELADTAPDEAIVARLTEDVRAVHGVRQVHDLRARHSGTQIFVELHIVVDPELTVREGHDIAREVKARLLAKFTEVTRVIIHVDPELQEEI
ncbi:MAG: cation diffusion facilitator family transporter [candidate division Zixibacteria bacterium]|nr:cation diffusion facilitator family transporter [candidate division Zixibacteria bacterium]